ncbi:MAG: tripartite tricarboxylate transporter substrate binding protein [Rhodospirillales bacterium]|nr:MAG: tripartite tricarboxylate transporter substrate binding protein [Rhodospirillales bacterium]
MRPPRLVRRHLIKGSAAAWAVPGAASGQDSWPRRPIKLVVPFSAGGTTDFVARIFAPPMSGKLGQQIVVENKTGAGGTLGADAVAKASNDGYTMGIATVSTHAIAPALMRRPPYQPAVDFTPIATIATTAMAIFANPAVGTTLADLQTKAKKDPGAYYFASPGSGSLGHLAGLWFNELTGCDLTHVPYRGGSPALQDLIAGRVQVLFDNIPTALPQVESGSVRALAVTSPARSASLPSIPTTAEAGLPMFEILSWTMLVGAPNLGPEIVEAANAAVNAVISNPNVKERLAQSSVDVKGGSAKEAANFLKSELAKWAPIAKASKVILD